MKLNSGFYPVNVVFAGELNIAASHVRGINDAEKPRLMLLQQDILMN